MEAIPNQGQSPAHPVARPGPFSRWLRRLMRDDELLNRWDVLFIRWIKHERVAGTNVFTDHTWLPPQIPHFPSERHAFAVQREPSPRAITAVFRELLVDRERRETRLAAYDAYEQRIFAARADLLRYLFEAPAAFVISMAVRWALDERNVRRRMQLKGKDNDPAVTLFEGREITNGGGLVINPFTVGHGQWVEWAESRLIYDFVRGVEMQILRRSRRGEWLRRWLTCTWRPTDLGHVDDRSLEAAIHDTLRIGSIRVVKLLKNVEVPGELEIDLPVPFPLLYRLVRRFQPLDLKEPFTRVFYPIISNVLGPGVRLGKLNLLDYFGVRWKCPCFWTGTSLFRVDRTILW
jgi:hypothetical protein